MKDPLILLVEDNPDDEELMRVALKRCGVPHRLEVRHDGVQALDFLLGTAPGGLPALVLLDLKMPKLGGLEVLRHVRSEQRLASLPVVVLTSSTEMTDIAEACRHGANSYICKPVDFDRFEEVVRQIGLYWLGLNQSPTPTMEV